MKIADRFCLQKVRTDIFLSFLSNVAICIRTSNNDTHITQQLLPNLRYCRQQMQNKIRTTDIWCKMYGWDRFCQPKSVPNIIVRSANAQKIRFFSSKLDFLVSNYSTFDTQFLFLYVPVECLGQEYKWITIFLEIVDIFVQNLNSVFFVFKHTF